MERVVKSGEIYRHFKNKMYIILDVVEHTETGEKMVAYKALYGDYKSYVRPYNMFVSEVDREKYPDVEQKYRFEKIGDEDIPYPESDICYLSMKLVTDKGFYNTLKRVEHHAEELLDLDSYPEIKSVYDVRLTKKEIEYGIL